MRALLNSFILRFLNSKTNVIHNSRNYFRHISSFGDTNDKICSPLFVSKRNLSNTYVPPQSNVLNRTAVKKDEYRDFLAMFPTIVKDLTKDEKYSDIPDVMKWLTAVLQYNVLEGNKYRGLILVSANRFLCPPHEQIEENLKLVRILGWCMELLQAFMIVVDDITDESETRRGQLCWYRVDGNDKMALNDSILLHCAVYEILRKYFADKPYYVQIMELFNDITNKTHMGQSLDLLMCRYYKRTRKMDEFTKDRYTVITKYKSAYPTYYLPVALTMHMTGISDNESHQQVKNIAFKIGEYHQIQNDYLDCYGDPESTGKKGTDIQVGKFTWLLLAALERGSSQQKAILKDCYGIEDAEKIEKVEQIYKDIGIPSIYAAYEEENNQLLINKIKQLPSSFPHEIFLEILDGLNKKSKN